MKRIFITAVIATMLVGSLAAQDIALPAPQRTGGMPLMEALNKRASSREFSSDNLDLQTLSNMLWAAWGYNRDDKRTAPSANNKQEISLYVTLSSGAYLYDAKANKLVQVNRNDVRKDMGRQDFVGVAPVNLVYVEDKTKESMGTAGAGFIAQNVYLFCTSEGLATVVRAYFDADKVKVALKLKDHQQPILAQTVGKKK